MVAFFLFRKYFFSVISYLRVYPTRKVAGGKGGVRIGKVHLWLNKEKSFYRGKWLFADDCCLYCSSEPGFDLHF